MTAFIKKRREFIVEEKDVTTVLSAINLTTRYTNYRIGSCGWEDNPNKWFIMFHATDKKYGEVMKSLIEIGKFTADVRPGGEVDLWFEKN